MYPIHCPLMNPPATLLVLGPMEQSVGAALNYFSNQKSGLSVSLIAANWNHLNGMNLGSADTETVLASFRRLSDAGEMLSNYYREMDARASSPTSTSSSQKLDMTQLHKTRLQDLVWSAGRKRDSQPTIGRGQWRLAPCERGQGVAYINEDGLTLHIRSVSGVNAVLGYGWVHSIMHYLGIDVKSPTGRSVALFENKELHSSEWSLSSFRNLIPSLLGIDLSVQGNAKLIIEGSDSRQQSVSWEGSATDERFLTQSFRGLSFTKDFSIATEDLANGTRNPAFRSINPPIPKASFRYLAAEGRVLSSLYRGEGVQSAEIGLSPDQRSRLYFPKSPSKSSSRPPSRVP